MNDNSHLNLLKEAPMKRNGLASIALLMLLTLLFGCGGGSDAPSSTTQSADPSTTEMPYGVTSMTVPYDDDTTTVDYVYDENGQVVAASLAVAHDYDGDGRDDYVQTADYTIDPSITVTDSSEIEDMSMGMESLSALGARGEVASRRFVDLSTTLGDLPGAVTRTESRWYSYGGRPMYSRVADDMITEQSVITTYSYDASGCVTEMESTCETTEAFDIYRITFAYDAQGRMTRQKRVWQFDLLKDGWIDEQSIDEITYAYDASGNKISKVEDQYNDSDLRTTTYAYDASGLLAGEDYKRIRRGGETVDQHQTIAYAHDAAGRLVQKVITAYAIDSEGIETPSSINTISFTYDDADRLVEKVHDNDSDADPSTQNSIYTDTYAYGQHGLTTYEYIREDSYGGGYSYAYDMTYNAQGQLTEKRRTYDAGNDGVADHFRVETYAYDTNGRLSSRSYAYHTAVGGEPGAASDKDVYAFSYDADGRLVGFSYEGYDNGTVMDEQIVAAMTYDAAGAGASGTVESFSLDETTGNMTSDGPAKTISFTFAAEAPTATMEITVEEFPYYGSYTESFEELSLTIEMPALFGLYYGSQMDLGPR
jgi:hypothetical protein